MHCNHKQAILSNGPCTLYYYDDLVGPVHVALCKACMLQSVWAYKVSVSGPVRLYGECLVNQSATVLPEINQKQWNVNPH